MEIINAQKKDKKNLAKIIANNFIDLKAYEDYKFIKNGEKKLYKLFLEGVENCIEYGICKKIVVDEQIKGCLLGFYFNRLKSNYKEVFDQFFFDPNRECEQGKLGKLEKSLFNALKYDYNGIYVMTFVVDKDCQNKKYGKQAFSSFINQYQNHSFVVDVDLANEPMLKILCDNQFEKVEELGENGVFVKNQKFETKEQNFYCDVVSTIPFVYAESLQEVLKEKVKQANADQRARLTLSALYQNTCFEFGVCEALSYNKTSIIKRLQRFYLENVKIKLKNKELEVGVCLTIDKFSKIAVVNLLGYGVKDYDELLLYLDGTSGDLLQIETMGGQTIGLLEYLQEKYYLKKCGRAKNLVSTRQEKIDKNKVASILMAETCDGLGDVVDQKVRSMIDVKNGLSQYSYATVYMSEKTVFQYSKQFPTAFSERIALESLTVLLIELVALEECAITLADFEVKRCLTTVCNKQANKTLKEYSKTLENFAETIDFWNVETKFLSTRTSLQNLRESFKIPELLEKHNRNAEVFQKIYEAKSSFIDKVESSILSTVGAVLTVISVIELVWKTTGLNKLGVATLVVGIFLLFKNKKINKKNKKKK